MRELLAIDCMPGGGPNPPPVGHFLRLAGDMPAPKRTLPESLVAGSCARTMLAGAIPAPKRTRRGSAIFLEGLRTTGCFLLDMGFLLECGFDEVQIANTAPKRRRSQGACTGRPSSTRHAWRTMKGLP